MHTPDRSHCWTPVRRWAWPLWSAGALVPTAAAPVLLWGSCDTGGRSVGTGLDWCIPCGPRRPCAWHQCPADWWCRLGRSGSWALCPAPPIPLKGSYLQRKIIMSQWGHVTTVPRSEGIESDLSMFIYLFFRITLKPNGRATKQERDATFHSPVSRGHLGHSHSWRDKVSSNTWTMIRLRFSTSAFPPTSGHTNAVFNMSKRCRIWSCRT